MHFCRYTYGEPVKGKLQLHVCLVGGFSYERNTLQRPCVDVDMEVSSSWQTAKSMRMARL